MNEKEGIVLLSSSAEPMRTLLGVVTSMCSHFTRTRFLPHGKNTLSRGEGDVTGAQVCVLRRSVDSLYLVYYRTGRTVSSDLETETRRETLARLIVHSLFHTYDSTSSTYT